MLSAAEHAQRAVLIATTVPPQPCAPALSIALTQQDAIDATLTLHGGCKSADFSGVRRCETMQRADFVNVVNTVQRVEPHY